MVIGCGARQDRVVDQMRGQLQLVLVGQHVEDAFGLGLDGEDAFDGVEGISAEAGGSLQGGQQIGACVGRQQGEHLEGLGFAVALAGQQAVEEAYGVRPEFHEAFAQHGLGLPWLGAGPMPWQYRALSGHAAWKEAVASDFVDRRTIDD